jgi:hypothetical protein
MKSEMRRALAQESFEEKIRKVGQLIQLSATVKSSRVREEAPVYPQSKNPPHQGLPAARDAMGDLGQPRD